ncbi:hypothetical protein GCM10028814_34820 [Angustibacter aerolatus]
MRDGQRAAPVRPLAQLRAASDLADDGRLRLRDHLRARYVTGADGGTVLRYRAGSLPVGDVERARLEPLLDGDVLTGADVGPDLAGRLLVAGVAVPAE